MLNLQHAVGDHGVLGEIAAKTAMVDTKGGLKIVSALERTKLNQLPLATLATTAINLMKTKYVINNHVAHGIGVTGLLAQLLVMVDTKQGHKFVLANLEQMPLQQNQATSVKQIITMTMIMIILVAVEMLSSKLKCATTFLVVVGVIGLIGPLAKAKTAVVLMILNNTDIVIVLVLQVLLLNHQHLLHQQRVTMMTIMTVKSITREILRETPKNLKYHLQPL